MLKGRCPDVRGECIEPVCFPKDCGFVQIFLSHEGARQRGASWVWRHETKMTEKIMGFLWRRKGVGKVLMCKLKFKGEAPFIFYAPFWSIVRKGFSALCF